MCDVLEVSRSGFYKYLAHKESKQSKNRKRLLEHILRVFEQSRESYGARRVHRKLRREGIKCNHKTVEKLMREHQITPQRKRRYRSTTDSKHDLPISQNILSRQFTVSKPNIAWVSDITYIETREGWMYLAVFIDLYSRKVVGWAIEPTMTSELILKAVKEATQNEGEMPRLIHSDRGSQYASRAFRSHLRTAGTIQSMSRKGNCWDNAVAESFFGSIKSELVYRKTFETQNEARESIFEYIEIFYNRQRLHSALDYLTPEEFTLKGKKAA